MKMPLFGSRKKTPVARKLRALVLSSRDWGFTDASVPKVRAMIAALESAGADVQLLHSALIARFFGDKKDEGFQRAKALFEEAARDPDFDGFHVGQAEGESENLVDEARITGDAFSHARKE